MTNTAKPARWWRIGCWLFGHRLFVVQEFSPHSRRICCACCGLDEAMNDDVRLVIPWTDEVEKFYRDRGHTIREINW